MDLGCLATRQLLRAHALPPAVALANAKLLKDRPNIRESPDLSPIRWRLKLNVPGGPRTISTEGLCDNGAHGEFISADIVRQLGAPLVPVAGPTSVRLPDGTLLPVSHQVTLTVDIDRQFKGDITFRVLPLKGMGAILGMPWLHRRSAVINHADKTVSFNHRGRDILLFPSNPVHPPPPIEPITVPSPWLRKPVVAPVTRVNTERPQRAKDPSRHTHLPSIKETRSLMQEWRTALRKQREDHAEELASLEAQGARPPPRACSLSSVNLFHLVEVNSAARFERALQAMTPEEALDCGTLYLRGDTADSLEISDLPFPLPYSNTYEQALYHLDCSYMPLFSLSKGHLSLSPPMDSLPNAPILSIPQYLDGIQEQLDAYSPTLRTRFEGVLKQYAPDVFPDPPRLKLGPQRPEDLRILEEPGSTPVWKKVYRLSPPQIVELKAQLTKMLEAGIIQPSCSPYGAPVLFAPKKDGGLRLCVDYRALNNQTIKDRFPIPLAEDLFDRLGGSKVFSKIDLFAGFWQIRIDPESVHKTAFRTPFGQYEWLSMPMGLSNSPSVFQRLVTRILGHLDFVEVFIDDILIHSINEVEHLNHISQVLQILQDNSLTAKLTKCDFFAKEVEFLGHVVSARGISMEPTKTTAITEWPLPQDIHELRSFIGLANYYRRYVENYAGICLPLFSLFKKGSPWLWTEAHTLAFESLKDALTRAPVLLPFNPDAQSILVTDASKFAIGAALTQQVEGTPRPVAFYSRKLLPAEVNYTTREQELLAIRDALKVWRHYLAGMPIEIHTDHESLRYIQTQPTDTLSPRLARWQETLSQYNFTKILHIKGKDNIVADALSRRPDLASLLQVFQLPLFNVAQASSSTLADLVKGQLDDPFCKGMFRALTEASNPRDPIHTRFAVTPAGTLVWTAKNLERIVVPPSFRVDLLKEAHDAPTSGHRGVDKMYKALAEIYYWPSMYKDVHTYVTTCASCASNKPLNTSPAGLAQPISPPELPWVSVGIDLVGPMPMSRNGNNFLVTFTDYLSRAIRTIPIRCDDVEQFPASSLAECYFRHVFRYHGLPSAVHTDRGSVFTSEFWTTLMQLCGTSVRTSTAFHPQTQGLTERANRTILSSLKHYLNSLYETWDEHVIAVEFAYNTSTHSTTGITPFEALYGFNPRSPLTLDAHTFLTPSPSSHYLEAIRSRVEAARDHLLRTQLAQAEALNKHRSSHAYAEGQQVWLSTQNLDLPYPTKFKPAYLGPFLITKMHPHANAGTLELPKSLSRHHPTFNVSLFKPYKPRDPTLGPSAHTQPIPIYADATGDYYTIERIVAEKRRGTEPIYTIKWAGYNDSYNTTCTHSFLAGEPGGATAITAWQARQLAVPAVAARDRAARHRYRGSGAAAPTAPAPPAVAPLPAPVPGLPPPAPAPAPPAPATRSGRVPRPRVTFAASLSIPRSPRFTVLPPMFTQFLTSDPPQHVHPRGS